MCPVCTVTVIAGLGLSRLLGIDDLITSIWIGAFILSFSFVTIDWIKKRWPSLPFNFYFLPTFVLMYLFVLVPFKLNNTIGIIRNTLWGIDKIVLGIVIGSIVFLIGVGANKLQRKLHEKIFFPFQKVVFPVLGLIIASVVLFFVTRH